MPQSNPLNHARVLHGSAVIGNTIYAFGGVASTSGNELTVEAATGILSGNSWEVSGNLPYNRRAFGYVAMETGGGASSIYIFGGNSGASVLATTQRFSVVTVPVEEQQSQHGVGTKQPLIIFPNPFYGTTTLAYDLTKSALVDISVYQTDGKLVARPVHAQQAAGSYQLTFDGTRFEPGVYFCKFKTDTGESAITRMVLIK